MRIPLLENILVHQQVCVARRSRMEGKVERGTDH